MKVALYTTVGHLSLNVDFQMGPHASVLIGPNGAGKTTLLLTLLGKIKPQKGFVRLGNDTLVDIQGGIDLPIEKRHLGYVPQNYALFPHLTVKENISFAVKSAQGKDTDVEAALEQLSLVSLASRRVATLSGGEKQRVALARALSVKPRALLLDEPLAALDLTARRHVRAFLATTLQRLGIPSLVVTHDVEDAKAIGQQLLALESGRLTQQGTWDTFVQKPATPFVAEFVAAAATTPPK